jgi:hypothetical protein
MRTTAVAIAIAVAALATAGAARATTTVYNYTGSIVQVTLTPGQYVIGAHGAEGANSILGPTGGAGAGVGGKIKLTSTTTLTILVGGVGGNGGLLTDANGVPTGFFAGSGGGGTFVLDGGVITGTPQVLIGSPIDAVIGGTPLLVAGGGGGAFLFAGGPGVTTNGGTGGGQTLLFTDGGGGGLSGEGGGLNIGPGIHVNGYSFYHGGLGGNAPLVPGPSVLPGSIGGFGGGGGSADEFGGGGGGYTGGASGSAPATSSLIYSGMGGGSFVASDFTSVVTVAGENAGEGFVTIEGIAAVPEPATWMMMFAGMGLVGCGLRRRTAPRVSFAI